MMEKIGIVIGGALLVGFILWWFFGKHTTSEAEAKVVDDGQAVTVAVDGGYTPNTVVLKKGVPAQIIFDRKDPSSCLSHVVFPDFGIDEALPLGEQYPIKIDTSKPGEYHYACGMNMFHGKVVVK